MIFRDYMDRPHYFDTVPAAGQTIYANVSGMSLTLDATGTIWTLTQFSGEKQVFDSNLRLTQMIDRVGNTQTISRDASTGNILSVKDSVGRQLCFLHDAHAPNARITSVFVWLQGTACPTAVPTAATAISFTYDTGVGPSGAAICGANALCSVTGTDGQTWRYGYDNWNGDSISMLTMVYDPLGNLEEQNAIDSYSGRVTAQQRGSGASTGGLKYFYYSFDQNGNITHMYVGHHPHVYWLGEPGGDFDVNAMREVTKAAGELCDCDGSTSKTYTYDQYGRILSESDPGNADSSATSPPAHTITYTYGRDAANQAFPGATKISETLDVNGAQRVTQIAYYPIGDPRQDLPRTEQVASVAVGAALKTTTYTYDTSGLLTQRSETGYTGPGNILATHSWNYVYDSRGRLLASIGPRTDVNQKTTFSYFPDTDADLQRAGQLQSITDALGHVTNVAAATGSTSYTIFGEPLSTIDPNGVATIMGYDANGRLTSRTLKGVAGDAQDLTSTERYDAAGRLVGVTFPLGNGVAFAYDGADRRTGVIRFDPAGNQYEQLVITYDNFDHVIARTAEACMAVAASCGTWSAASYYQNQFDVNGKLSEIDDPPVTPSPTSTDAQLFAYTAQGKLALYNDENHTTWLPPNVYNYGFTYDQAGRRTSEIRFLVPNVPQPGLVSVSAGTSSVVNATTSYAYDTSDDVTSVTDPNGNVSVYQYDDFGRLTTETSPTTGKTLYQHDADDNLTEITDATGATTQYTYDALNRPTKSVSTKAGQPTETVTWSYDDPTAGNFGIGRLASMIDPTGTTTYTYDRRGLVTMERRALASATFVQRFTYDGNGNRATMTYPSGNVVSFGYDYADRPYSAAVSATIAPMLRSRKTQIRPPVRTLPRRSGTSASPQIRREHLPVLTMGVPLPRAPIPVERRRRGQKSGLMRVPVAYFPAKASSATFLRLPLVALIPRFIHTSHLRRAMSGFSGTTLVASTIYAPFGPVIGVTFGNGAVQTLSRDARYRPVQNLLLNSLGATEAQYTYTEDAAANITRIDDGIDAAYTRSFTYDDANRLLTGYEPSSTAPAATAPPAGSAAGNPNSGNLTKSWGAANYTYDAMGNILTSNVGGRAEAFNYASNSSNGNSPLIQNVVATGLQTSAQTTGQVSYDAAGNETAVGLNRYAYSARNHLAYAYGPAYGSAASSLGVSTGGGWQYGYDGFGQRVSTTQLSSTLCNPPTVINHVPLPLAPACGQTRYSLTGSDGLLLAESTFANSGQSIQYEYVWMGGRAIAQLDASGVHYTMADHLGTPLVQTDGSSIISWWADYEPYGAMYSLRSAYTSAYDQAHQPLRFPGQIAEQFDSGNNGATDLSYNNARWYRPSWGRYTQSDPERWLRATRPYQYALSSPLGLVDPSGRQEKPGEDPGEAEFDREVIERELNRNPFDGKTDREIGEELRDSGQSEIFRQLFKPFEKDRTLLSRLCPIRPRGLTDDAIRAYQEIIRRYFHRKFPNDNSRGLLTQLQREQILWQIEQQPYQP